AALQIVWAPAPACERVRRGGEQRTIIATHGDTALHVLEVLASQAAEFDPHRLAEVELGAQTPRRVVDADFLKPDRLGFADVNSIAVGSALDQRLVDGVDVGTYDVGRRTGVSDGAVVQPDRALAHH